MGKVNYEKVFSHRQKKRALIQAYTASHPDYEYIQTNAPEPQIFNYLSIDPSHPSYAAYGKHIHSILTQLCLCNSQEADELINPAAMIRMIQALTHYTVTNTQNCEIFKTIGETAYQKAIDDYIVFKHPELYDDPKAHVKLTEALKFFTATSKEAQMCKTLQLDKYIYYMNKSYKYTYDDANHQRQVQVKTFCLEDDHMLSEMFLSFLGGMMTFGSNGGLGYMLVYHLVEALLQCEDIDIALDKTLKPVSKLEIVVKANNNILASHFFRKNKEDHDVKSVELLIRPHKGDVIKITQDVVMGNLDETYDQLALQGLGVLEQKFNIRYVAPGTATKKPRETSREARIEEQKKFFQHKQLILRVIQELGCLVNFDERDVRTAFVKRAFTHPTYDSQENYEMYETLGDKSFNLFFKLYLTSKFPELMDDYDGMFKLDEATKEYVSTKYASKICEALGLHNFVVVPSSTQVNPKLKTDILESVVYLIERTVNKVLGHEARAGFVVVYSVLSQVIDRLSSRNNFTLSIDPEFHIPANVKLKQIMDRADVNGRMKVLNNGKILLEFKQGIVYKNKTYYDPAFDTVEQARSFLSQCGFEWKFNSLSTV